MPELASLATLLRHRAQTHPDRGYTFLGEGEEVTAGMTYADLDRRARSIAAALRAAGMARERVLLLYPQGLDFIAGFFGCLYAGAVAVPAYPPRLSRPDPRLAAIARDCRPRAVLTVEAILARAAGFRAAHPELADLCWLASDALPQDEGTAPEEAGGVAFLQYTSGSTGTPKGVVVTHANLLHNEEMIRRAFGQSGRSVVVGWLPLFHDMGLIGNVLQPLYTGGRCVLLPPVSFLQKPVRWLRAISRFGATTSGGPDFAYALCAGKIGPEQREGLDLSSWSVAYNGAEPVRAETLERFAATFAPHGFRRQAFYPCYGLAEATLLVSGSAAGAGPRIERFAAAALEHNKAVPAAEGEDGRALVGCGMAWLDQEVVIADPATGAALPPGRTGEIWVSGPSVAAGYWDRPEESGRTFHARLADGRGPFLRTGDLGFLHRGTLFLSGRLKDLIILRGRNLYPQDLEATAERSHPAFRPGGSAAFAVEVEGEERLVLVQEVEPRQRASLDAAVAAEAIRRAVAEAHEVQAWEVVLAEAGAVPRTSSGKVQRRACRDAWLAGTLPVLARSRAVSVTESESLPGSDGLVALKDGERATVVASWLQGLVALVAGTPAERIDPDAPLLALGLDSVAATELRGRVETALGVEVPITGLLGGWSLRRLADEVLAGLAAPAGAGALLDTPARGRRDGALSYGQKALWFLHRLAPESTAYNLAAAVRLVADRPTREEIDRAFQNLVERHPALRTAFVLEDGEPRQVVAAEAEASFREEDGTAWSGEELERRLAEEAERPFDLARGPLLRVLLVRRSGGERILLLAMHHIVSDFWSLALLVGELDALCAGAPLAPLPLTFADHVAREERLLAGPRGAELAAYWSGRLGGGLPVLDLPTDRPRPPVQTYAGAAVRWRNVPELRERLAAVARERGATPFMALLAAYAALLQAHTGQDDLIVGTPSTGRTAPELSGVVGYCVNPVALRLDVAGDPAWSELLARVRSVSLEAFAHQEYPFALLAERLLPERDPSRPPVAQTLFSFQRLPSTAPAGLTALALGVAGVRLGLRAFTAESLALPARVSQVDLSLAAGEVEGGLAFALHVNRDLFDASTAARLAVRFDSLLAEVALDPERRLSTLALTVPTEREQVLFRWNDTAAALAPLRVEDLVARQVARSPETVAAACGDARLTYGELWHRAGELAVHLRRRGVRAETPVGLFLEPSLDVPAALLGVFRAGGAYVPLDLDMPAERLAMLLEDSRPAVVLTRRAWVGRLPASVARTVFLEDLEPVPGPEPEGETRHAAEGLAYVLYTSGSTGRPKGVQITHRALVNFLTSLEERPGLGAEDVLLAVTPLTFDIAGLELFLPLSVGARVEIVPREVATDGRRLAEVLALRAPTVMQATPSTWKMLLEGGWARSGALRIFCGGEALSRDLADRLLGRCAELWNLYGPTETTIWSCAEPVGRGAEPVPIGRPIANTRVYVVSRFLQPLPPGVAGELLIGGDGLARGYLGRPDLTAGRFLPDSLGGHAGERLYRTGDLARFRPDGALDYLGRLDFQVKLRGFRIEPGEIEAALRRHPGVDEAVVVAAPEADGARLVAFVVPAAAPGARELRDFLRARLPEAMIPGAFVALEELPLTHNGKLDRQRLPLPAGGRSTAGRVAPRTPVEEVLAGLWSELLGVEHVGVEDDFFELGGHSLKAAQLASRVHATFGVELPLRSFFQLPTMAGIAALLAAVRPDRALPPIERAVGDRSLSFGQQRLWLLDQLQPGGCVYNMAAVLRLAGSLDVAALAGALGEIVRRHEVLRTAFPSRGGRPVQEVSPWRRPALPLVDLAGLPTACCDAEAAILVRQTARQPFDLAAAPPLRFALLRRAADDHELLVAVHHIAADAWSVGLFLRELASLYAVAVGGGHCGLQGLPVQYADYAAWQRGLVDGSAGREALAFWTRRLAGAPVLELVADRPRPAALSSRGIARTRPLPDGLSGRLATLARRAGATPFMAALAAGAALLARYTGGEDLVVGTPVSQRDRVEAEGLIGFFVNTLALRLDLAGAEDVGALLGRVREAVLEAHENRLAPFERLVEELAPERGGQPLVQAVLAEQDALPVSVLPGLAVRTAVVPTGTAKFDLSLFASLAGEYPTVAAEASADLWEVATVERLLGHLSNLLVGIAAGLRQPVDTLPLLGEDERRQLLAGSDRTAVVFAEAGICVHRLVERRAAEAPDAPAVVEAEGTLTYGELDRRANRLARRLLRLGLGPDAPAAIRMQRSAGLAVAALAVLKSGGAYLPIDPAYPEERSAWMLRQSGARVLLAGEEAVPEVEGVTVLGPAAISAALAEESAAPLAMEAQPDHLAYVIYTSGSTGRPKGVAVPHAGLANLVAWHLRAYGLGPGERVAQTAGVGFDASVWEIWPCLAAGAALHPAPADLLLSTAGLVGWLAERRITAAFLATPLAEALLAEPQLAARSAELALRVLLTGGDRLQRRPARALPFALVNHYGPTENSVVATCGPVEAEGEAAPAIGGPIANVRIHLLDRERRLVPAGVPGEVCIGGAGLARGYLRAPELTAAAFVPDPFGGPGERLYRTGDMARRLPAGDLAFLGRADQQVKIRGVRIEPGEIEAVLLRHPAVAAAVAGVVEGPGRLVAWIVPCGAVSDIELAAFLGERLPAPMVPGAWVRLPALPLTAHGKIDRRALPPPAGAAPERSVPYLAPRSDLEEMLVALWADLLRVPRVGALDDFFELGGHSLQVLQLVSRLRDELEVEISPRDFFREPTVAGLSVAIAEALLQQAGASSIPDIFAEIDSAVSEA